MNQPTIAQKWARERNGAIWRLRGLLANVINIKHATVLTPEELQSMERARLHLERVIRWWKDSNEESKQFYIARRVK